MRSGDELIRGIILHVGSGTLLICLVTALLIIAVISPSLFSTVLKALADLWKVARGA